MKAFRFLLSALFFCTAPAAAEVTQASASGFATRAGVTVSAPAEDVWAALIEPARWWNGSHSWSGDAANLSPEPWAGGCFCERLPPARAMAEGSVQHMTVIHAAPGRLLRLIGALGPLQSEALTGTLSISIEAAEGGTAIEWIYVVGGQARFPLEQIAPGVDGVMTEQMMRLAALFETVETRTR